MSSRRSRFPEHPILRLMLGPFRALDGLLVILAWPFGVLPRLALVGLIQFLALNAAIYVGAWKFPRHAPLLLAGAWIGMLAVGRSWVKNEKHRSNIARKLVAEIDPDRRPDLRLLALLSSLQVFVIFPLLFWNLSNLGPNHEPLLPALADLFVAAEDTPWWHWPLYTLEECLSPFLEAGQLDVLFGTEIIGESDIARTLVGVLRTTLEWLLFVGLWRLFAIRRTCREVVSDAALRNDNEMAVRLGRRALGPLIRHLRHPGEDVRIAAAMALGRIGRSRATRPLIRLFETDSSRDVCEACAASLGQIGDCRAVAPLLVSLKDEGIRSAHIRNTVARALGQLGDDRAVLPLIERLGQFQQDIDRRLRSAARCLFPKGSRFEVDYELPVRDPEGGELLRDDDGEPVGTRRVSYEGEVKKVGIDPQSGRGPYILLYNEKFSTSYRSLSLVRIRDLRPLDDRDDFSGSEVRHALKFVRDGLRGLFLEEQVVPSLGRIGDQRAAAVLVERLGRVDQLPVIEWLGKGSPDVTDEQVDASRESAILALQRIGDAGSCEVMLEILRGDHSESLKQRAAVALAHLPGGTAQLDDWLASEAPEAIRDGIRDSARNWWNQIDRDIDETSSQLVVVDRPRTGRTVPAGISARPSLPELPFTILIDREQLEVREINGNRLSVSRPDGRGSSHEAGAEIRLVDLAAAGVDGGHSGGIGRLLRAVTVLLLVVWGGVGLAYTVLPRLGYEETTIGPRVATMVKTVHGLASEILPPEIGSESLPFQLGLFLVPAVVVVLGLFAFRSRRVVEPPSGKATGVPVASQAPASSGTLPDTGDESSAREKGVGG